MILKSLLFLLIAPGTVLVLIPYWILRSRALGTCLALGGLRWLGLIPVSVGLVTLLWSFWAFAFIGRGTPAPTDPPTVFVAEGFYRFVRNPMYAGVLLILVGEGILFQSPLILLYSIAIFLAFHLFVVLYEEPNLRERFGASYAAYVRNVPRWIIRVPRKVAQDETSDG